MGSVPSAAGPTTGRAECQQEAWVTAGVFPLLIVNGCDAVVIILLLFYRIMAELKERTFIAIKPDGVQRGIIGEIIKRFEVKGFKLVGMKMMQVSAFFFLFFFVHLSVMHWLFVK